MTQDEYTALVAETEGHTPGPWKVTDDQCADPEWKLVANAFGTLIANVNDRGRQQKPNARLIAAAPALLAEVGRLREALAKYADPGIYAPHPHGPAFDDRDLSWIARQALKGGTL
jgi:hypothetical protein